MLFLRSLLFTGCFYLWTLLVCLVCYLPALLPFKSLNWIGQLWARGAVWLLRHCCGITHEVRGAENIPQGTAVFVVKHQSAWETMIFYILVRSPAYILKQELLSLPLFGFYLTQMRMIIIDRQGHASTLKKLIKDVRDRLSKGKNVVLFPEGTRVALGEERELQPGALALYGHVGAPLVPVALNSGVYWPRYGLRKHPGVITVEFFPPLPQGLSREAVKGELEEKVIQRSRTLSAEGGGAR